MSIFFIDPTTTEIYTLSLHDALPILRDLPQGRPDLRLEAGAVRRELDVELPQLAGEVGAKLEFDVEDRKSTRLNSSHSQISYAVFCLKKKKLYDLDHLNVISNSLTFL